MLFPHRTGRRYLVTGGFGYAGSYISEHLAAQGHEVFVLSRRADNPGAHWPCTLISADLENSGPEEIAALLPEDLTGIVHAASLNEEFLPDYPRRALLANALGTRNLLAATALCYGREKAPLLVYCSTIHVYGPAGGNITEASPALPHNDYALTHYFGEEYCRLFMRTRGLPSIIARLANGYGAPKLPGSDKWHLLLNDLCKSAVQKGGLALRSHPDTPRDFIWLGDAAKTMNSLLTRPDLAGRIFNVSTGASSSIGAVARLVAGTAGEILGKKVPLRFDEAAAPPEKPLHISNKALVTATGQIFEDRMREEIVELLAKLM